MNDQQLENKVRRDADKVKKDIRTLLGHGADRIERFEDQVSQGSVKAKEDLATWAEDSASQVGDKFEKVTTSLAQQVSSHPWVAISIGLAFGFLLGSLIKPVQHFME